MMLIRRHLPVYSDIQHLPKYLWRAVLALLFVQSLVVLFHHPGAPLSSGVTDTTVTTDFTAAVTLSSNGRLGNQMGAYAVLYALAKLHGWKAYVQPRTHKFLSPLFSITIPLLPPELKNVSWTSYELEDWMSEKYYRPKGKYIKFVGYFCAWTFFHHLRKEILREFTFHDHIAEKARMSLAELREGRRNPTYVGVHVRRSDYLVKMGDVKGVVADAGYFKTAMNYFRSRYQQLVFVVVSDDMPWCRRNINSSLGDVYFVGRGAETAAKNDLALLAQCNHTILSIGTFGFWAAYMAGGEAIYLANHTLPDSYWLDSYKAHARNLPHWIGIQANLSSITNSTNGATTAAPSTGWLRKLWKFSYLRRT